MKITNYAAGPRGINLKDKPTLWVEPGQEVEFDKADVVGDLPDFGKPADQDAQNVTSLAEARAEIARLTARIVELEAGSAAKRPGLTGKGKDALLKIAADEGVDKALADDGSEIAIADATNAQIVQAIEAAREAA